MATLIVARDQHGGIGRDGELVWHCPEDLQHFRSVTNNKTVLMGVQTALTCIKKPLTDRNNWVLIDPARTTPPTLTEPDSGWRLVTSVYDALKSEPDLVIIGGAALYHDLVYHPLVTDAYVTELHHTYECDRFFRYKFDYPAWTGGIVKQRIDNEHGANFTIYHYRKVSHAAMGATP